MFDGLWTVEFTSAMGLFGRGVLVIKDNKMVGGDMGYYYSGTFTTHGDTIKGSIEITRFDPNAISILGDIERFSLDFQAKTADGTFEGSAAPMDNPALKVNFKGIKREDM